MSLRLKFLRDSETLKIICAPGQREKYERVAAANGGKILEWEALPDGLRLTIVKAEGEAGRED